MLMLIMSVWQCVNGHWDEPSTKIFFSIFATCGAVWLTEYQIHAGKSPVKSICHASIPWLLVIVSIVIWHLARPSDDFSVRCETSFIATSREAQPYYLFVQDEFVYPIHVAILLTLTNLKPEPFRVDRYWVETRQHNKWKNVRRIDIRDGLLFLGANIMNARQIEITHGGVFDSALEDNSLKPKEPIQGMVFLQMPKDGVGNMWRMRLRKSDGTQVTRPINFTWYGASSSPSVQRLQFKVRDIFDLTHHVRQYLDE